eukprot:532339-Alexandrium_andersonii.AAC.1
MARLRAAVAIVRCWPLQARQSLALVQPSACGCQAVGHGLPRCMNFQLPHDMIDLAAHMRPAYTSCAGAGAVCFDEDAHACVAVPHG